MSPYESVYLAADVFNLISHWIEYFNQKLKEANDIEDANTKTLLKEKYDGALWSLNILKNELNY